MINIALVGCAHIHTPGFVKRMKARTDVSILAVWDHDAARAAKNAAECGAPAVADLAQIWGDKRIQAVVICTETNRHEEVVLAAAAAKKHMFVEKPLGFATADAAKMAKAIRRARVVFQTGYFMRGDAIHLFLKDAIAKGYFGRITRARHSNCHSGSLGGWFDTEWRWMADPSIAGCGAYGDLGTHSLDILMWLFGDDVKRVTASIQAVTNRYGACDETGEGIIEFASGVTATLAGAWLDVANPVRLLVSGTEGHACVVSGQLFFQSKRVEGADGKQPWTALPPAASHAFELFLDTVAGKPTPIPLVTVQEAAARSAVMTALYQAAAKGKWIRPKKIK